MDTLIDHASQIMTVISFATFIGILWWTYGSHSKADFDQAAQLPFDDEEEARHV